MNKILIFSIFFGFVDASHAFLDFLGKKADDALSVATYADSVGDLLNEFDGTTSAVSESRQLSEKLHSIANTSNEIRDIGESSRILLRGPNWTSERLDENIRSTTDFIRRAKNTLLRIKALGPQGITAVNTFQTNMALNEIQKNQQLLIYQNEKRNLSEAQKEIEQKVKWMEFMNAQKKFMVGERSPLKR